MPNWCDMDLVVTNYNLKTTKEIENTLNELKNKVMSNKEAIDANKIIPMPDEVWEITSGGFSHQVFSAWYGNFPDVRDGDDYKAKQEELLQKWGKIAKITADKMKRNVDKHGAKDWYEWANKYWGTKWGIVDSVLEYDGPLKKEYNLFSAWSPPTPVFDKLAEKYPNLHFVLFVHESGSSIYGEIEWYDGEMKSEYDEEYTGTRGG